MRELELERPVEERLVDAERSYLESLRNENYLGKPKTSVRLKILDVGRIPEAVNVSRFESSVSDLYLLSTFRDIEVEDFDSFYQNPEFRKKYEDINIEFSETFWEHPVYLKRIHQAAPVDVDISMRQLEAEIDGIDEWISMAHEIEEKMNNSEDFVPTGLELDGEAERNSAKEAYRDLKDSLSINLHFRYAGDEEAVDKYNDFMSRSGFESNYAGIPGIIFLGADQRPTAYMDAANETGVGFSDIENWLAREMHPTVATVGKIEEE